MVSVTLTNTHSRETMQDPKAIIQILDQAYYLTQVIAGRTWNRGGGNDENNHMLDLQTRLRCAIMGLEETAPEAAPEPEEQDFTVSWTETTYHAASVTAPSMEEAKEAIREDAASYESGCYDAPDITNIQATRENR